MEYWEILEREIADYCAMNHILYSPRRNFMREHNFSLKPLKLQRGDSDTGLVRR
jgi:hypothetical protein